MADQPKQQESERGSITSPSELESRLLPILDNDGLTKPGQRSGQGLASILPYLVKALRARPKVSLPERDSRSPRRRR